MLFARYRAMALGVGVALASAAGCNRPPADRTAAAPSAGGVDERDIPMTLKIESPAFAAGAVIPARFTGDGEDVSPPLKWSGLPAGVKEVALVCDDPDAPTPQPWVHWVIYGIPATAAGLPENVDKSASPAAPAGAAQGKNSWSKLGYGGPAPPPGHGVHHYHFKLYALDAALGLKPGLDKPQLLKAMKGHILAQGELMGTYQR